MTAQNLASQTKRVELVLTLSGCFLASALGGARHVDRLKIKPDLDVAHYSINPVREPRLSRSELIQWVRKRVKYVFVIYQENRSFDSYFGTFPGADGIYSKPPMQTPGFYQPIVNTDGTVQTVHPFRIGPLQDAADLDDVDHGHLPILHKMHIVNGKPEMNRYAVTEERRISKTGNPTLKAKQYGELTMAYEDGDTIPFLWRYANRFVLCDHIFQTITGPSTPGNLSIIGAQSGATQWMLHPSEASGRLGGRGVPVLTDANPYWKFGRNGLEASGVPPTAQRGPQINLTYATIPLTLTGRALGGATRSDRDPKGDLADVADDVRFITGSGNRQFDWGWFQEGFDLEPTDDNHGPVDAEGMHFAYVAHHNGPQYFGYISNNPRLAKHLHGLNDFYTAIAHRTLKPGLFYIKGGHINQFGLHAECPAARAQRNFTGDDDHPGDSDSRVSESMVAETVNKIAASPYWKDCAIIITWDDSEGDYDHVRPPMLTIGPDGKQLTDGPRVPLLLISPYSRTHFVDHAVGSQSSVVRFADAVFGLTPLAQLPDERKAIEIGLRKGLMNEGPTDDSPLVCSLVSAFDPARLLGKAKPLPGDYAMIPESLVRTQPAKLEFGLGDIGVMPTDYAAGIHNDIPADFDPRPSTTPTQTTSSH